jgi:hypothetical protein
MDTPRKITLRAVAVAATLVLGGVASTPASAEASSDKVGAATSKAVVGDTDVSSHRRYRRYGYVRPFPAVYPYRYGYYRPRPYFYRPSYYAAPYAYPYRPVYYRPYYAPAPFFGIGFGFGPRHYW